MKIVFVLSCVVLLAACTGAAKNKLAIMYNPETKDTQRCEVDLSGQWQWEFAAVLEQCIKGYEAVGYQRVDISQGASTNYQAPNPDN